MKNFINFQTYLEMFIHFPAPVFGFSILNPASRKTKIIAKFQDIFRLPKRLSRKKYKNKEHYYVLLERELISCESCPARSKALDSESSLVGVRAFESHLSHQTFLIISSKTDFVICWQVIKIYIDLFLNTFMRSRKLINGHTIG